MAEVRFDIAADPSEAVAALDRVQKELLDLEKRVAALDRKGSLDRTSVEVRKLGTDFKKTAAAAKALATQVNAQEKELKQLSAQLRASEAALKRFQATGKGVGTLRKRFTELRTAIGLITFVAVTAGLRAFVSTVADFGAVLARVQALTGATGDDLQRLEDIFRELGQTTIFSATQAAEGGEALARAGLSVNQVIGALPGTLRLAVADNLSLAEASRVAAGALEGFGIAIGDLPLLIDKLTVASTNSQTRVSELGESFQATAAIADGYNLSVDETIAVTALLSNSLIKGGKSGIAFRNIIAQLTAPSKKLQKLMRQLNIDLADLDPTTNSLADIFRRLGDSADFSSRATEGFQRRSVPAILALSKAARTGEETFQDFVKQLEEAEGATQRVADQVQNNLAGSFKLLKSALSELALAVNLEQPLKGTVDGMTALLAQSAGLRTGLQGLAAIFVTLKGAFETLFSGIRTGAVVLVNFNGVVIAGILEGIAKLAEALAGFTGFERFARAAGFAGDAAEQFRRRAAEGIADAAERTNRTLQRAADDMTEAWGEVGEAGRKAAVDTTTATTEISEGAAAMAAELSEARDSVVADFNALAESGDGTEAQFEALRVRAVELAAQLDRMGPAATEAFEALSGQTVEEAIRSVRAVAAEIEQIGPAAEEAADEVEASFGRMADAAAEAFSSLKEQAEKGLDGVVDASEDAGVDGGVALGEGLVRGFEQGGGAEAVAGGIANAIDAAIARVAGQGGPGVEVPTLNLDAVREAFEGVPEVGESTADELIARLQSRIALGAPGVRQASQQLLAPIPVAASLTVDQVNAAFEGIDLSGLSNSSQRALAAIQGQLADLAAVGGLSIDELAAGQERYSVELQRGAREATAAAAATTQAGQAAGTAAQQWVTNAEGVKTLVDAAAQGDGSLVALKDRIVQVSEAGKSSSVQVKTLADGTLEISNNAPGAGEGLAKVASGLAGVGEQVAGAENLERTAEASQKASETLPVAATGAEALTTATAGLAEPLAAIPEPLGQVATEAERAATPLDDAAVAVEHLKTCAPLLVEQLEPVPEALTKIAGPAEKLAEPLESVRISFETVKEAGPDTSDAIKGVREQAEKAKEPVQKFAEEALEPAATSLGNAQEAAEPLNEDLGELKSKAEEAKTPVKELGEELATYGEKADDSGTKTDDLGDGFDELGEDADELEDGIGKLASTIEEVLLPAMDAEIAKIQEVIAAHQELIASYNAVAAAATAAAVE